MLKKKGCTKIYVLYFFMLLNINIVHVKNDHRCNEETG